MSHDEIKELKNMLEGLQNGMNQRFDTIDRKLEKISNDIESIERVTKFREIFENIDRFAKHSA